MSILPENKIQPTIDEPRNFFIYGKTMSGKSFLAGKFPDPLFLNTDGNAKQNPYPNIQLRNRRNPDGTAKQTVIEQIDEIMLELETKNHGFKTVIVDVIDDVCNLIEQAVCLKAGVEALSDIPYGKGYATFNSILQEMVMELKSLPINVVYISRVDNKIDDSGSEHEIPSLKTKYYNIVNGNCDLVIHTQKVGTRYIRAINDKRKDYYASHIQDPKVLRILKAITGALQPEQTKKDGK